jgi:hypothetical protein
MPVVAVRGQPLSLSEPRRLTADWRAGCNTHLRTSSVIVHANEIRCVLGFLHAREIRVVARAGSVGTRRRQRARAALPRMASASLNQPFLPLNECSAKAPGWPPAMSVIILANAPVRVCAVVNTCALLRSVDSRDSPQPTVRCMTGGESRLFSVGVDL